MFPPDNGGQVACSKFHETYFSKAFKVFEESGVQRADNCPYDELGIDQSKASTAKPDSLQLALVKAVEVLGKNIKIGSVPVPMPGPGGDSPDYEDYKDYPDKPGIQVPGSKGLGSDGETLPSEKPESDQNNDLNYEAYDYNKLPGEENVPSSQTEISMIGSENEENEYKQDYDDEQVPLQSSTEQSATDYDYEDYKDILGSESDQRLSDTTTEDSFAEYDFNTEDKTKGVLGSEGGAGIPTEYDYYGQDRSVSGPGLGQNERPEPIPLNPNNQSPVPDQSSNDIQDEYNYDYSKRF